MRNEAGFDSQIERYLEGKAPHLRDVVQGAIKLIEGAVPGAEKTLNPWHIPTYELNGPLFYLDVSTKHVTLGFLRGTSVPDPDGLLEGTGKNLRHVKLRTVADVGAKGLRRLVQAAAKVNRAGPPADRPGRIPSP